MLKLNDADDKSTGYKSKATPFLDALGLLGNPRKPRPKNKKAAANLVERFDIEPFSDFSANLK